MNDFNQLIFVLIGLVTGIASAIGLSLSATSSIKIALDQLASREMSISSNVQAGAQGAITFIFSATFNLLSLWELRKDLLGYDNILFKLEILLIGLTVLVILGGAGLGSFPFLNPVVSVITIIILLLATITLVFAVIAKNVAKKV